MKKNKIPTIFALLILVLGLIAGVVLVRTQKLFQPNASVDAAPKDMRITNIGDSSFSVSWATEKSVLGFVKWGNSSNSINKSQVDDLNSGTNPSFTHSLTVTSLNPNSTYFFSINSGGSDFDNNGAPWQVKTAPQPGNQKSLVASGTVLDGSNNPVSGALVYLTVGGGSPISTTTSTNGTWVTSISNIRTLDLSTFLKIETNTLIDISVNAGPLGVASAKATPEVSKKTPPIILGKTLDFRDVNISADPNSPNATLQLPDKEEQTSKFNVGSTDSNGQNKVSEDSIVQGEVVNTGKPQFFGTGPKNTDITIKIESEVVTKNVKIGEDGKWKLDTPSELSPGSHKITITWKDSAGVVQTLTKFFVVMAADGPAFEASVSATPTNSPTVTPTSTLTPTLSPTLSPIPEETFAAIPTQTASSSALLDTGSLTPTILLFMMGLGTMLLGILVWKRSE